MSSEEPTGLLAGHPPAVKVGGMRVGQHKPSEKSAESKKEESKDKETVEEPTSSGKQIHIVSGAVIKGDADFPPAAIKAFHETPTPTHQYRQGNVKGPNTMIHQPRK